MCCFCVLGALIIRVTSKNRPGFYWAIDEGVEGYLMRESELFRVISPGLWGPGSISFESVTRPGDNLLHVFPHIVSLSSISQTNFCFNTNTLF